MNKSIDDYISSNLSPLDKSEALFKGITNRGQNYDNNNYERGVWERKRVIFCNLYNM